MCSSKWNSQVNNLVFGLALWKALASFRHDLAGSSGFSADAHQHQVSFGLSFKQVGLWFIHPLGFGSSPPHSRLCRLADSTSTPSPSIPLVHQLFLVRPLVSFIMIFYLYLLAQILCWEPNRHEIQDFCYWFSSLMRGLGRHMGGI